MATKDPWVVYRKALKQSTTSIGVADILRPLTQERLEQLADEWDAEVPTAEVIADVAGDRLLEILADLPAREIRALAAALGLDGGRLVALARPPETRADCVGGLRPCPYTRCRYSIESHKVAPVCVLDVADDGGANAQDIAHLLGVSRQRVDQLLADGLESFFYRAWRMGLDGRSILRRDIADDTARPAQRVTVSKTFDQ